MATLNSSFMTLHDYAESVNARDEIIATIDILSEMNPIFDHAPFMECNEGRSHVTSMTTALPAGTWTSLYEGIPNEKGRRSQVRDTTAMLESLSTVDERLLAISKNPDMLRLEEATMFLEGMSQTFVDTMFYGDGSNKKFLGLAPRFNDTSNQLGAQIIDAGGTGSDNTSVWIITWHPQTCHMIFPSGMSGMTGGIKREDMGRQRVLDGSSNAYYVREDKFHISAGLTVRDWRYVTRIANLDVSNLAAGSVDTLKWLRKGFYQHEGRRRKIGGKTCVYARREFIEAYDEDTSDKTNVQLSIDEADGRYSAVSNYRGIPIFEVDGIHVNEAQVT